MSQQLSSQEQKEAYKIIQKGGDVPLHGLRKPAPEKPQGRLTVFLTELTKTPLNQG